MEEIKSIQERAKEYAAKWNEYRRENIDKEFTKSYLNTNVKLPYRSRVSGGLCKNSHYTKVVGFTGEDERIKVYKFTEHPIHYSFMEKIITDAYEYNQSKKRKNEVIYNNQKSENSNHNDLLLKHKIGFHITILKQVFNMGQKYSYEDFVKYLKKQLFRYGFLILTSEYKYLIMTYISSDIIKCEKINDSTIYYLNDGIKTNDSRSLDIMDTFKLIEDSVKYLEETKTKTETETRKLYTENEIALRKISDRELVAELYKRGYTGKLTQVFDLDNPNF